MPKSKLLKELVSDEISIIQAIDRLYLIAHDLKDDDVCLWIKSEKNGYKTEQNIPDYRKTVATPIGTYQIYSAGNIETYHDTPLPVNGIPKEEYERFQNWYVRDSIVSLVEQLKLSKENKITGMPLDPMFFEWFQRNSNIIMRKAMLYVSPLNIDTILCSIKSRIIDLLLLYEDNFGCLDSLDIDISGMTESENQTLRSASRAIISGDVNGKAKIIIKGSNIGKDNKINKEANLTTSISVSRPEKKCFIRKLFKKG